MVILMPGEFEIVSACMFYSLRSMLQVTATSAIPTASGLASCEDTAHQNDKPHQCPGHRWVHRGPVSGACATASGMQSDCAGASTFNIRQLSRRGMWERSFPLLVVVRRIHSAGLQLYTCCAVQTGLTVLTVTASTLGPGS